MLTGVQQSLRVFQALLLEKKDVLTLNPKKTYNHLELACSSQYLHLATIRYGSMGLALVLRLSRKDQRPLPQQPPASS